VTRRNALVRKSTSTSLDLSQLIRERDAEAVYDRMPCGCAWWSGKNGTSRWEHTAACGPWPAAYPSKRKYRGRT
jgi:hypothetical protein